jgi:TPP-dependent indolepyruvate ferredoxin oxidoreductase alpha subunit
MTDVTEPTVEVTTEIKPEEVKVEETKAEEKPTTEIDRVARIEKHQREQRQKLEAEKLRLEADRAELQEFKRLKQLKNDNPLEVLKSLGLSIDDIVKAFGRS